MILKDVFLLKNPQIISEDKGNKTLKIRGTFQRADEANANRRVYPRAVLEGNIKRLQPLIENRALLGELDHPELEATRLSNSAVLITKLGLKGNEVIGEAEVLNTPGGQIVKTLINDKVTIGISSRGVGNLLPEAREDGCKVVGEDYKLITFDIVADPSTRGAYPSVCESKEYIHSLIKDAYGEELFIALAKESTKRRKDLVAEGLARTQRIVNSMAKKVDSGDVDKAKKYYDFYKKTVRSQGAKDNARKAKIEKGADSFEDKIKDKSFDHRSKKSEKSFAEAISFLTAKILEGSGGIQHLRRAGKSLKKKGDIEAYEKNFSRRLIRGLSGIKRSKASKDSQKSNAELLKRNMSAKNEAISRLMEGVKRASRLAVMARKSTQRWKDSKDSGKEAVAKHHLTKSKKYSALWGREKVKKAASLYNKEKDTDPASAEGRKRFIKYFNSHQKNEAIDRILGKSSKDKNKVG